MDNEKKKTEILPSHVTREPIRVLVFASLKLIGACLRVLLNSEQQLAVTDVTESHSELLERSVGNPPDVVLLYLMDEEGNQIEMIEDLFDVAPDARVVVLTDPQSNLDQPASLKLGVAGIVATNQTFKVLTRAIRQVSEGDVWLNQKLVEQLLRGNSELSGNSNGYRYTTVHDLTTRELEIIENIGCGMNNKEISAKMSIREATVRHHLSSIYSKLHIEDRLNLAIFAFQKGIITPPAKSM
jgi:DNA-binding NarL/FixJ family response regulator